MLHKDLDVYKHSILLVKEIYALTSSFPREEIYGLSSQMRRAAISIPANIAEGCGRKSEKELLQFLNVASGSLTEMETHLEIALVLEFVSNQDQYKQIMQLTNKVKRLLIGLIKSIRQKDTLPPNH